MANGESNERDVYLKQAAHLRRALDEAGDDSGEVEAPEVILSEARFAELGALEEFILTITEKGMGKRSSSHEYRRTGRGGQGIANIDISARGGPVVTTFPVTGSDQIMMVTDGGQVIEPGSTKFASPGGAPKGCGCSAWRTTNGWCRSAQSPKRTMAGVGRTAAMTLAR